jgi:hypothetical protein
VPGIAGPCCRSGSAASAAGSNARTVARWAVFVLSCFMAALRCRSVIMRHCAPQCALNGRVLWRLRP